MGGRAAMVMLAVGLVLLAGAVRAHGTATRPVWSDEAWTAWSVRDPAPTAVIGEFVRDRHPPGYFIMLGAWSQLVGRTPFALRWLSVLGGVVLVAGGVTLARWAFGARTAPWAGLALAVYPAIVYYSSEIRDYGWLMTTCMIASLLWWRAFHRPTVSRLAAYALACAVVMYTLYFGAAVLAAQGLLALGWPGPGAAARRARFGAAYAAAALLYAPWAYVVVTIQAQYLSEGVTGVANRPGSILALVLLLGGGALGVGLALVGLRRVWRSTCAASLRPLQAFVAAWGVGVLALFVLSNVWLGTLTPRTTVIIAPGLALLAGAGLAALPRPATWLLGGALAAASLLTPPLIQPHLDYPVLAALAPQLAVGDTVILETGFDDYAHDYVLAALAPPGVDILMTYPWRLGKLLGVVPVVPEVRPLLDGAPRLWVVHWHVPPQVLPALHDGTWPGYSAVQTLDGYVGDDYAQLMIVRGVSPIATATLFLRDPALDAAPLAVLDADGVPLSLMGALHQPDAVAGAPLWIDVVWQAGAPLPLDYSVGVALVGVDGQTLAVTDGALGGDVPSSRWVVGARVHQRVRLDVPPGLAPGDYALVLRAYYYEQPGAPFTTGADGPAPDGLLRLGTVRVGLSGHLTPTPPF